MILQKKQQLELPFKPFTVDEVCQLTGVKPTLLDVWMRSILKPQMGSMTIGLEYMQTFTVFVAKKFLDEGADGDKVDGVMRALLTVSVENMAQSFRKGDTFPVPHRNRMGHVCCVMVPAPKTRLGGVLRLDKLHAEFRHNLAKLFPGFVP